MLDKLLGVKDIIETGIEFADEFFHTDEEKAQFKERFQKRIEERAERREERKHEINLGQIEVNKEEAKSRHWWVAGWRPAVGWVCVTALFLRFIVTPLAAGAGITIPEIEWQELSVILLGILGIGGLRTIEKQKGLTK